MDGPTATRRGTLTGPDPGTSISTDPLDRHVAGLKAGDESAFAAVYDQTAAMLASVAKGLLGSRGLAEDVVQDAFVKLAQHAPGLHGTDGRSVRAWLVRTVRNRCLDVRGSAAQRLERASDAFEAVERSPAADASLDQDLSPELADALAGLTDDQRTALVLAHVVGFSGNEIAAALGRSRAAVYTLLRRAERSVRAQLGAVVR